MNYPNIELEKVQWYFPQQVGKFTFENSITFEKLFNSFKYKLYFFLIKDRLQEWGNSVALVIYFTPLTRK